MPLAGKHWTGIAPGNITSPATTPLPQDLEQIKPLKLLHRKKERDHNFNFLP